MNNIFNIIFTVFVGITLVYVGYAYSKALNLKQEDKSLSNV